MMLKHGWEFPSEHLNPIALVLSPWVPLGPLKWLQVTSTEPAHSLQNNYPNPPSRPNPLTLMKCPPMQGADIFQQHWPLWNANQKSFLLKYMTLSASINRPSYIIATTIIKKHLQYTHLCTMLCCWAQPKQVPEVLTSGRTSYNPATSRFFSCLFNSLRPWAWACSRPFLVAG